ncbi:MAG: FHA domain-containing protein [Oligoflexia bacterium]|nr:FHA domain-containing protein [Oligoflexia bacterium]
MSQLIEKSLMKSFVLKILQGSYKGKQLKLLSSEIKIGRSNDCDIIFKDDSNCSRHHAQIQKQGDSFLIRSLNPKNPVLVNKKAIESRLLQIKDTIQIGQTKMVFLEQSAASKAPPASFQRKKSKKSSINPARLILITVLIAGAFLFFSENPTKNQEEKKLQLTTEADILNQVEELKKQNEEEFKNLTLDFKQEASRIAFISGFRDYRKGYFHRALKLFKHCSMLDKGNELCRRYELKSHVQIEKLIQKKVRLGNSYKANKQYEACSAVFKSIETMILDVKNPIYKEAKAKRLACSLHLRNKI